MDTDMQNYIGSNETRYSTEDLNAFFHAFVEETRRSTPEALAGKELKEYTWGSVSPDLPLQLRSWTAWTEYEVADARDLNNRGGSNYSRLSVPGPWFVRGGMRRQGRRYTTRFGRLLHVLTPKNVLSKLPPMEALANSQEDVLPKEVLVQILWTLIPNFGIKLLSREQRLRSLHWSDAGMGLIVARAFVAAYSGKIRILKRIETPAEKRRLSPEDSLARLLKTYKSGGAARSMEWKLWAAKARIETMHHHWIKTEKQLARVEKKGGTAKKHPAVSEVLRQLAAEYEIREKANG